MSAGPASASTLGFARIGSGPPLVLLHGIGDSRATWAPVLDTLAARHEVIALDLPGFGESLPLHSAEPPVPARLAVAVADWLDAHDVPPAAIAGSSLGGWVALELAAMGRATSVVCLSPAGFWGPGEVVWVQRKLALFRRIAHLLVPPASGTVRPRLAWMFERAASRTLLTGMMLARPWQLSAERAQEGVLGLAVAVGWDATLAAMTGERYVPPSDGLRVPVTIAWGGKDRLLPASQRVRAKELLPAARVGILPGCGHLPMWDDPELVGRVVLRGTGQLG